MSEMIKLKASRTLIHLLLAQLMHINQYNPHCKIDGNSFAILMPKIYLF